MVQKICLFYKICNHDTPQYLHNYLPAPQEVTYRMRSSREFNPPASSSLRYSNSFFPYFISEWEKLSDDVKSLSPLDQFKSKLLIYIYMSTRTPDVWNPCYYGYYMNSLIYAPIGFFTILIADTQSVFVTWRRIILSISFGVLASAIFASTFSATYQEL